MLTGSSAPSCSAPLALCAFLFDAAAVRLWFLRHHAWSIIIGLIAAAALVVTFTNSLGAIAGRSDTTLAERSNAKVGIETDRAELKRITRERARLAEFTPATADDVKAATEAVAAAERIRAAECGNGDPKQRGANCRTRESEEQARRAALSTAIANKSATDKAAKLDGQADAIRARLAKSPQVQDPNPLGAALEQIIGGAADFLTAWQQAVAATVFELCLLGVMVIFELLGQRPAPPDHAPEAQQPDQALVSSPAPTQRPSRQARSTKGSVKAFFHERVSPADGDRVEMKTLLGEYRAWCANRQAEPLALANFLEEIDKVCRKVGLGIETTDERVYCVGVTLDQASSVH